MRANTYKDKGYRDIQRTKQNSLIYMLEWTVSLMSATNTGQKLYEMPKQTTIKTNSRAMNLIWEKRSGLGVIYEILCKKTQQKGI